MAKVSPSANVNIPEPVFGELDGEIFSRSLSSSLNLKNLSLKNLYSEKWNKMKPWSTFIDTQKMKLPENTILWSRRLIGNIDYFTSNYLCVFIILVIYCILTSPLLLLALAASLGACYIITLKNQESPFKIMNYQLTLYQQYLLVGVICFPLFYLAGAGSAVFWVTGASFFVIGLHASLFAIETISDNDQDNDLENNSALFATPFSGVETV